MKNNVNINKGETDVKKSKTTGFIDIDFGPLYTKKRDDDKETWNSMQFYCENDEEESRYQVKDKISDEAMGRIKDWKIGHSVLNVA